METVASVWKNDTHLDYLSFDDIEKNKHIKLSDQGYNVMLNVTRYQKIKRMKEVLNNE